MTGKEAVEAARDYVAARSGTIDQWGYNAIAKSFNYGVSYRVYRGDKFLGKVMGTGFDLLALMDSLKERERRMIAGEPEPATILPDTATPPTLPPVICSRCGTDNYPSNQHCRGCGVRLINISPVPVMTGLNVYCLACGTPNSPSATNCCACGCSIP